jgi:hypothetical protein
LVGDPPCLYIQDIPLFGEFMKRIALLLLTLVLCFPHSAHADEASRRAKSKELLSLLHMDKLMAQMMDNATQQVTAMTKQMAGDNVTPADQARINDFQKKIFTLIEDQMGWSAMEPAYVDLYAKNFTEEELDGILAFYKSPAGISMVQKLPALTSQGIQLAQDRMASIQPQLRQMIDDFAKNAPSAGPELPTGSVGAPK